MAKVLLVMARQMLRLEQTVESLVLDTVEERLACLLVGWRCSADRVADGDLLPAHTQEEIAKLIAANPPPSRPEAVRTDVSH
jgi:hypothetical protein